MAYETCACGGGDLTGGTGSGGSLPNYSRLVEGPAQEPLTLAEAKLRAGLDWPEGDPRDAQMQLFIKAARERVERDTGLAMLTQTRDVHLSHLTHPSDFPSPVRPLQSIVDVAIVTAAGERVTLSRDAWAFTHGRLRVTPRDVPPLADLYPYVVRIVVGWETVAEIPPLLQFAIGLLCAHYATAARDAVVIGTIAQVVPLGYEDAIHDFRPVAV